MRFLSYNSGLAAILLALSQSPVAAANPLQDSLGLDGGFRATVFTSLGETDFYNALQTDVTSSTTGVADVFSAFQAVANTLSSGGTADVAGPSSAGVGKLWTASVTFGAKSLTFNFPNGAEDPIFQAVASGNTPLPSGPVTSGPITQAPGPIAGSGLGALALLGIAALLMRRRRLQA